MDNIEFLKLLIMTFILAILLRMIMGMCVGKLMEEHMANVSMRPEVNGLANVQAYHSLTDPNYLKAKNGEMVADRIINGVLEIVEQNTIDGRLRYVTGFSCILCGYIVLSDKHGICPATNTAHFINKQIGHAILQYPNDRSKLIHLYQKVQPNWRRCKRCQALVYGDGRKINPCVSGQPHNLETFEEYACPLNTEPIDFLLFKRLKNPFGYSFSSITNATRWCSKCNTMTSSNGTCMVDKKPHYLEGSGKYSFAIHDRGWQQRFVNAKELMIIRFNLGRESANDKIIPLNIQNIKLYDQYNNLIPNSSIVASASSVYLNDHVNYGPANLLDHHNKDDKFAHTDAPDLEPWLKLTLNNETLISKFEIENRRDCCKERIERTNVYMTNGRGDITFVQPNLASSQNMMIGQFFANPNIPKKVTFRNKYIVDIPDDNTFCGVNKLDHIYCSYGDSTKSSPEWKKIDGSLKYLSLHDKHLYGVNSSDDIWVAEDSANPSFKKMNGKLKQVSLNGNKVCGVNVSDDIYCADSNIMTSPNWFQLPGKLKHISLDIGRVYGVNSLGELYFAQNYKAPQWQKVNTFIKFNMVKLEGSRVYGISTTGDAYYSETNIFANPSWIKIANLPSGNKFGFINIRNDDVYATDVDGNIYHGGHFKIPNWRKIDGSLNQFDIVERQLKMHPTAITPQKTNNTPPSASISSSSSTVIKVNDKVVNTDIHTKGKIISDGGIYAKDQICVGNLCLTNVNGKLTISANSNK